MIRNHIMKFRMVEVMVQSIFVCLTSYQYMVADLLAKENYRKSGHRALIILKYVKWIIPPHNEYAEYVMIPSGISGKIRTLWYSIRPWINCNSKDLYFFNDRDPITKNIAQWCDKKILVEEGLGTYFAMPKVKVIGEKIIPDIAYVGYPELYKLNHEHRCECKKIDYKSFFNEKSMRGYFTDLNIDDKDADIIFLGQATTDMDELRNHEISLLKFIQTIIPNSKILIKPHPRDRCPEKYLLSRNIVLLNDGASRVPIEALIFEFEAKCIITVYSSAVITLSNMFLDIDIIMAYLLCDIYLSDIEESMRYFADFSHNIHIPSNEKELRIELNGVL